MDNPDDLFLPEERDFVGKVFYHGGRMRMEADA